MNTKALVVNIEGHSRVRRAGPITMDNVVIDNIGPRNVYAEYADITLGPGGANFRPDGRGRQPDGQQHRREHAEEVCLSQTARPRAARWLAARSRRHRICGLRLNDRRDLRADDDLEQRRSFARCAGCSCAPYRSSAAPPRAFRNAPSSSTARASSCRTRVLDCRAEGYDDTLQPAGLVGYACTGEMRPDLDATMVGGGPLGAALRRQGTARRRTSGLLLHRRRRHLRLRSNHGVRSGQLGLRSAMATIGQNPSIPRSCAATEPVNATSITTAARDSQMPSPCVEDTAVSCDTRLLGFRCKGDRRPRGEDYGPNRSRADYYYPLCSIAEEQPNPDYNGYCCYMTLTPPVGATCVQHPGVPGCESGTLWLCLLRTRHAGRRLPADGSARTPGSPARSAEGYAAKLYCCDFT